jgi:hypothetical protein
MKRVFIIVMCLLSFILGACAVTTANAEQTYPLKIWKQNENGKYETMNLVDEDTGVNYIVVSGELYSNSIGLAMCPRYNADGSLYVTN